MAMSSSLAVVNVADLERLARQFLPKRTWDYYSSGAMDQQTLRDNVDAFLRVRLRPRVLRGVTAADTRVSVLGMSLPSPLLVAPTAFQRMAHDTGECATSRACASRGTVMCVSSWATTTLEDIAAAAPDGLRWFQLYVYRDRVMTAELIRRAERAGYRAIALTVDTPALGRRENDIRNGFGLPPHLSMANFAKPSSLEQGASTGNSSLSAFVASEIDATLSWADIAWIRSITSLPVIVKGVHTAEDARLAAQHGCDAVWVSNHAARQLDGVLPTIEMLPEVVEALKGTNVEVFVDGGVRRCALIYYYYLTLLIHTVYQGIVRVQGAGAGRARRAHRPAGAVGPRVRRAAGRRARPRYSQRRAQAHDAACGMPQHC